MDEYNYEMRVTYLDVFVKPWVTFSENYKGKASKMEEGTPLYA